VDARRRSRLTCFGEALVDLEDDAIKTMYSTAAVAYGQAVDAYQGVRTSVMVVLEIWVAAALAISVMERLPVHLAVRRHNRGRHRARASLRRSHVG
jgi:hypothetical protein